MLKRYYYLVNPLCAMAAQGMKTYELHSANSSLAKTLQTRELFKFSELKTKSSSVLPPVGYVV